MNNKTYAPKKNEVERKSYIIDASGKVLGKVATEVAKLLRGKHKPEFATNMDMGDFVIVINCKDIVLTGKKMTDKMYRRHSGYIGSMKELSAEEMMKKDPAKVMYLAVKGMLPHTKLGRAQLKKLRVYADDKHEHDAQKPEVWEVNNG